MIFDIEKFAKQLANRNNCSMCDDHNNEYDLQLEESNFLTNGNSIMINQLYVNYYEIPYRIMFQLDQCNSCIESFDFDVCIIDDQKKDIQIQIDQLIEKTPLGKIYDEINITFKIEINKSNPIFLSLDLETPMMPYKIGQTIFDLAILAFFCGKDTIVFESNKWYNFTIRRPLDFEDYALVMIYEIYEFCSITPHNQIYFIAHNGFDHDYPILFDNLEKSDCINVFRKFFQNAIFLDSLVYFRCLRDSKKISMSYLSLENIYNSKYPQHRKKQSHTAKSDAQDLIDIMKTEGNNFALNPVYFYDLIKSKKN